MNDELNDPYIPEGLWIKCDNCKATIYNEDFELGLYVCPECNKHFRIGARKRIEMIADLNSFKEEFETLSSTNFLNCPMYDEKLEKAVKISGLREAVITGTCTIEGIGIALGVMDTEFIMGSMGSVVGEKITRLTELAIKKKLPLIIFTASGGARMQEGIVSLMQMAKTSAAIAKHNAAGLLYIPVLTDPTTGGVTASFAMLGDIILAEPNTLIGFAGPRVIKQTINCSLPEGFQTAEFLLKHGFVDRIVERKNLKSVIAKILRMHNLKKAV